jgi:sulfofructose kinase
MKIVGVGLACLDFLAFGKPGTSQHQAYLNGLELDGGGLTATALVAARRLGAGAFWLGRTGSDWVGDLIVKGLRDEGVETSYALRAPDARGAASVIFVDPDTGDRIINYYRGSGQDDVCASNLDLSILNDADAILLDDNWIEAAEIVAEAAHAKGIPVVADIQPREANMHLIPHIHALIVPRIAGEPLAERVGGFPEALQAYMDMGAQSAVITMGADGCWYSDGTETSHLSAFNIKPVDTTGAGDVFHGAYAVALADDMPIRECCRFSSGVSALKCLQPGGRRGIPTREELMQFLNRN